MNTTATTAAMAMPTGPDTLLVFLWTFLSTSAVRVDTESAGNGGMSIGFGLASVSSRRLRGDENDYCVSDTRSILFAEASRIVGKMGKESDAITTLAASSRYLHIVCLPQSAHGILEARIPQCDHAVVVHES